MEKNYYRASNQPSTEPVADKPMTSEAHFEQLDQQFAKLFDAARPLFSDAELFLAKDLVRVGEYGVALEEFCALALKKSAPISAEMLLGVEMLAKRMEFLEAIDIAALRLLVPRST
ncbi:MAG: hypothetical protein KBA31_20930 [Alphaproteobacteria bacterium]|nr:hypothetical protein [Alphaproteobacteria bacterium]